MIQETVVQSLSPVLGPGILPLAAGVVHDLDAAPLHGPGHVELGDGGSVPLLILDVQLHTHLPHSPRHVGDVLRLHSQTIINLRNCETGVETEYESPVVWRE